MPVTIVAMGALFNMLNAAMQGGWLFYISEPDRYGIQWLCTPQFICGTIIFLAGMAINIHSDSVIRHLRKDPADTGHYLPDKRAVQICNLCELFRGIHGVVRIRTADMELGRRGLRTLDLCQPRPAQRHHI